MRQSRWTVKEAGPRWKLGAVLAIALSLLLPASAPAQHVYPENQIPARGIRIEYTVTIRNPVSHLYDVQISIEGVREPILQVAMPAWSPGDYTIRNYARNVQAFRAAAGGNTILKWEKIDKQTWKISKKPEENVTVQYQLFSAQLTDQMADLSGPETFMYVMGHKHVPVSVKYDTPDGWKVYTGLDKRGDRYDAADYDIFIDAPAFIGDFRVLEFQAAGAPHYMVFSKKRFSMIDSQVIQDTQDIVEAAAGIFGKVPYKHYTFLFKIQARQGSGGLEHLNSTRITVGENDFVNQNAYRRFLFVVAHEYFHLWNVKRIRPKVIGPLDYTREVYTKLLWVSEGLTSYYGNLLLARAGILTVQEYFDKIGAEVNELQHTAGRSLMSVEEASWDTWIRSDNAVNNTIDYYNKGELIGVLLDIEIRARTKNRKSLDDVMRYLMQNFGDKGAGLSEDGFLQAVEAVAESDFDEFFAFNVQSRQELDYNAYLKQAGLQIEIIKQPSTIFAGLELERADGNLPRTRRVLPNSPAERAGLDAGDVLIAMGDERLTFDNFTSRLHSHAIGEKTKLAVMRGERLLSVEIIFTELQDQRWTITENPNSMPEQVEFRKLWLGMN